MDDDLDLPGCNYVNKVDSERFPSEETYKNYFYLVDDLREPFTEAFNLNVTQSRNMSFMDAYGYSDVVQSREFEFEAIANHTKGYQYTDDQMTQINDTVLATLVLPLNNPVDSRNLYVSKQLRLALDKMNSFKEA